MDISNYFNNASNLWNEELEAALADLDRNSPLPDLARQTAEAIHQVRSNAALQMSQQAIEQSEWESEQQVIDNEVRVAGGPRAQIYQGLSSHLENVRLAAYLQAMGMEIPTPQLHFNLPEIGDTTIDLSGDDKNQQLPRLGAGQ